VHRQVARLRLKVGPHAYVDVDVLWERWIGLDWIGLGWVGLDWIGLGWVGVSGDQVNMYSS